MTARSMIVLFILSLAFSPSVRAEDSALYDNWGVDEDDYAGDLKLSTVTLNNDHKEYDLTLPEDLDKIRRMVSEQNLEYAKEFVKNFDMEGLKKRLSAIFPEEYVNKLPDHILTYVHDLDNLELDDYFASVDNNPAKDDIERMKLLFVIKCLAEHSVPPGGEEGHGTAHDDTGVPQSTTVPSPDGNGDVAVDGNADFWEAMHDFEDNYVQQYVYKVSEPRATDQDEGDGPVKEVTDDFGENIPLMQKIAQSVNGLPNSLTSNWWRNLQGAGVEQTEEGNSSENGIFGSPAYQAEDGTWWRVKPDWWWHRHKDGTVRSWAQEDSTAYQPAPLISSAQLLSTEMDIFDSDDPLAIKPERFRGLVANAEQKVLYVDYEHYPADLSPGKVKDLTWAYSEDGTPIMMGWYDESLATMEQIEGGIRFDQHNLPDGTPIPEPGETIVPSNHPYGTTTNGGHWDTMIIRAVYWKDINIPIYQYDKSFQNDQGPDAVSAEGKPGSRTKVENVILAYENEVDLEYKPVELVNYTIPPLLEAPLPPTTYTRDEYPLGVSYGGMGGQ